MNDNITYHCTIDDIQNKTVLDAVSLTIPPKMITLVMFTTSINKVSSRRHTLPSDIKYNPFT